MLPVDPTLTNELIEEEGVIPWPYLDTRGNVTVGVGHRVPDLASMLALPFLWQGTLASPQQIRNAWTWLIRQKPGLPASAYRYGLTLSDAQIRALLEADLESTQTRLVRVLPAYSLAPAPAQKGLLDMAFNLGVAGLILKFPMLIADAERGNWTGCAAQCIREGVSDSRNQATQSLFRAAALGELPQPAATTLA